MSGCIRRLSNLHSPVFLLNSCLDLFSAPPSLEDPLSRGYGVSLPSSLTVNHSSASVFSTRLRVSVCGTGHGYVELSGFSREHDYVRCRGVPGDFPYCRRSPLGTDLPAPIYGYDLQPAIPSAGGTATSPSPHRHNREYRNIDLFVHRRRRSAGP